MAATAAECTTLAELVQIQDVAFVEQRTLGTAALQAPSLALVHEHFTSIPNPSTRGSCKNRWSHYANYCTQVQVPPFPILGPIVALSMHSACDGKPERAYDSNITVVNALRKITAPLWEHEPGCAQVMDALTTYEPLRLFAKQARQAAAVVKASKSPSSASTTLPKSAKSTPSRPTPSKPSVGSPRSPHPDQQILLHQSEEIPPVPLLALSSGIPTPKRGRPSALTLAKRQRQDLSTASGEAEHYAPPADEASPSSSVSTEEDREPSPPRKRTRGQTFGGPPSPHPGALESVSVSAPPSASKPRAIKATKVEKERIPKGNKKSTYVPTGRPRGRPRKVPVVVEETQQVVTIALEPVEYPLPAEDGGRVVKKRTSRKTLVEPDPVDEVEVEAQEVEQEQPKQEYGLFGKITRWFGFGA